MASKPSAIVGTIRFSIFLEESNFFSQLSGLDYTQRKAKLIDRARLNRRFQLFEDVCLPSLKKTNLSEFQCDARNFPRTARLGVRAVDGFGARRGTNDWDVVDAKDLAKAMRLKFPHLDENTLTILHVIFPN